MPISILSERRNELLDRVMAKHKNNSLLGKGFKVGIFNVPMGELITGDTIYTASGNHGIFIGINPRSKKMPLIFEGFSDQIYSAGIGALRTIIPAE